ncbi:hypothetical protein HHI36_004616, partial [Cryptolaemus montrouzieri]
HLTSTGYCATGTIRDNRVGKCPHTEKPVMQKQKRGTYDFRTDNQNRMCLARWKDNK